VTGQATIRLAVWQILPLLSAFTLTLIPRLGIVLAWVGFPG
jgi:hypothetical protein